MIGVDDGVPVGHDHRERGPVPAILFGATATRHGGVVTSRRRYPHASIAPMRSGRTGVFQRGQPPLPIRQPYGPSVWRVALKHLEASQRVGIEAIVENLRTEL